MSKVQSKVVAKSFAPKYEGYLPYENVEDNVKHLSGEILTIIDGAIVNETQNKAVKDQIKNRIQEILYGFQFYAYRQSDGMTASKGHSVHL